jgi:hypothetical protein
MLGDDPFPILTPSLTRAINAVTGDDETQLTLLIGDSGVGKSFALQTAARRSPSTHAVAVASRHLSTRTLIERLLEDVGADREIEASLDPMTQLLFLTDRLIDALSEHLGLVTIDDAHLLPSETLGWLRHLIDVPEVSLVLAGRPPLVNRLPCPMLQRAHAIRFNPLHPAVVPEVIPRFHPVWVGSSPETIKTIDERYAEGYFGRWADATDLATQICAYTDCSFITASLATELLEHLERSDAAA